MFIREYIEFFDYLFWIDDDAFFVDLSTDLMRFVPKGDKVASFCRSPTNKSNFTYLSSGQFVLKGGKVGAEFVNAVLGTSIESVRQWWRAELGMFTHGDQDAIVYLLHEDPRFASAVAIYDYHAFNSRIADLEEGQSPVFLLHFVGSHEQKHADHAKAMKLLNTGPSLLPRSVEEALVGADRAQLEPTIRDRVVSGLVQLMGPSVRHVVRLRDIIFKR
jgi:hypothetical protein